MNEFDQFVKHKLKAKYYIRVDFLGWINFPDHWVLRTTTKRRVFKRTKKYHVSEVLNSYLGLLGHGNTYKIRDKLLNMYYNKLYILKAL